MTASTPRDDDPERARREFLKAAGRFAAYTPPVIVALLRPSYAKFLASGGALIELPPKAQGHGPKK